MPANLQNDVKKLTHYSRMTSVHRLSLQALLQARLTGSSISLKRRFGRSSINREINPCKPGPAPPKGQKREHPHGQHTTSVVA